MPASLIALCNDCVASLILKPAGFVNSSRRRNDLRSCTPNACQQILFGKAEMKADYLRMELDHEIAHFIVEGSEVGARSGSMVIESQVDIVAIQASSPPHSASWVLRGLLVAEKVHVDWTRCLSAYDFEFPARLLEA